MLLKNLIKIKFEYIDVKKKKTMQIYKVLKFHSMSFYILKLLYDTYIINAISYIFFNVHNQAIITLMVTHSITNILSK